MNNVEVVSCPLGCVRAWEVITEISPDFALLNILFHIMRAHPDVDALELLDQIEYEFANPLVTNGA